MLIFAGCRVKIIVFFTYLIADSIVIFLFSADFLLVNEILVVVMIAEVFRIFGGIYVTSLLANQLFKQSIFPEFGFAVIFIGHVIFQSLSQLNLLDVALSYLLATIIYFLLSLSIHYISYKKGAHE